MNRILHVSNRVCVPQPGEVQSGGLDEVIAQAPKGDKVVRIGWNGKTCGTFEESEQSIERHTHDGVDYIIFPLPEKAFHNFYNVIANGFLWPVMHDRIDIATGYAPFGPFAAETVSEAIEDYKGINKFFAKVIKANVQDTDKVVVHDYHLFKVGDYLKGKNVDVPIGFFLHIPAPSATSIEGIREHALQGFFRGLLHSLYEYDFVGVQSNRDYNNLSAIIGQNIPAAGRYETKVWDTDSGKKTKFGVFPVAGNYALYEDQSREAARNPAILRDMQSIMGRAEHIDIYGGGQRLDYTKGMVALCTAVGKFLREHQGPLSIRQIAPPGRQDVPAYVHEKGKVEGAFEMLNAFGADAGLVLKNTPRQTLLGLARFSKVITVAPLRDGFNLAALELLAGMDPKNPASLILSQYAGASEVLCSKPGSKPDSKSVLLVDPADTKSFAQTISRAWNMSLTERQERYGTAMSILETHTAENWHNAMHNALS